MDEVTVRVEALVNLTESEKKVRLALENVFGSLPLVLDSSHEGNILAAEARGQDNLVRFRNLLRNERIRAAARRTFFQGMERNAIDFCLNKQAAFMGHLSFSEENSESPLGPIKVKIVCEHPKELVDWLAPRTA